VLLAHAVYKNFDSWLTGTITFNHDENDCLSAGHFKGENGFDADITFENDDNGNVVRIHWELSSGDTQTYVFEYEKIKR